MPNPFDIGLAVSSFLLMGLIPLALLGLAIPYVVLRLRSDVQHHPQLGMKAGLQYFFSLAIIFILVGATVIVVDLMVREDKQVPAQNANNPFGPPQVARPDDETLNESQRVGLGMIISGTLIAFVHFLMALNLTLGATGHRVRQTFLGWRFAIHGLVVFFSLTILIILCLQPKAFEEPLYRGIKSLLAVLVIWVPSWMIHYVLLRTSSEEPLDRKPSREEDD